jgi:hypothetical protein
MKIEVDDEFMDELVGAAMVNAYLMLKDFLKQKDHYHPDDVAAWEELLPAVEKVANWYMVDFQAQVKKAKKEKK